MSAALEILDVTKSFGGALALDRCSLAIPAGGITGLIGPNGAGKTTLLNVVCGVVAPDTGRVLIKGDDVTGAPAHRIAARGVVRTFQIVRDLAGLTVLETLLLAASNQIGESIGGALFRRRAAIAQERRNARKARDILGRVGLWTMADALAGSLSGGQKKLLEFARALMLDPAVVLLDEPAAGVAPPLLDKIVSLIGELQAEGLTFAIIEHDMQMIGEVCDHVHVLAEGRLLVSGTFAQVAADPRVVEVYLGAAA